MITKTANYRLIDIEPLNKPTLDSMIVDQHLQLADNVIAKTTDIIKTAKLHSDAEKNINSDNTDFDLEAEIKSHPNSLFVKCFAIKADETNDNGDHFSKEELKKATPTFIGVPVFTNHNNTDAEQARGKVVYAWWDEDRNGIMIIARVDAEAYPQLARGIKEEYIAGCFPPDAPVLMADGTEKNICDIEDGDIVISGKGNPKKVLGIRHRAYDHPLLSVKIEGIDQPLIMTSYHNVVVYRLPEICACGCGEKIGERKDKRLTKQAFNSIFKQGHNSRGQKVLHEYIQIIPAYKLKINDLLIEPKVFSNNQASEIIREKEAFLIGLFLAKGSYEKRDGVRHSVIFNFGFTEAESLAKKTAELLEEVFFDHRNKPTIQVYPEASQSRVCLYGKDIAEWFYTRCGEYSDQKQLYFDDIINQPKEVLASLVAGYIEGDGWNVNNRVYGLTTASSKLASQLRVILSTIGVRTRYRVRKCDGWGYKPVHEITFGISTAQDIHQRLVYKRADKKLVDSASWHSLDDITLRRVQAIEEVNYKGIVYDIEVEDDHTYCVNHIAVSNTSMGCQVQYSICSVCHNVAETPDQYCSCIRERKTRKVSVKNQKCQYHKNGTKEKCPLCGSTKDNVKTFDYDGQAFEYNYDIKFIENSFVVNPACHDCGVTEVIDTKKFLSKVADIQRRLPRLLKAASQTDVMCSDKGCVKLAGQKELESLNQALELITSVSQSMLQQKDQLDLEFVSDLVSVLSDLQQVTDELTQQGYGRLPSPDESGGSAPQQISKSDNSQIAPVNSVEPASAATSSPAPVSPGNPNIYTGPAGDVGTVTTPFAQKKLNLSKIAQRLFKTRSKIINSGIKLKRTKKLNLPSPITNK